MKPYTCDYENDGERITSPGKFEGEPVFAPAFWDCGLNGFSDSDNGTVYGFKIGPADFQEHPTLKAWMGRKRVLFVSADGNGFVHCFTR